MDDEDRIRLNRMWWDERELARQAGIGAEFIESGVYDAAAALGGRTFDVVYTSIGAIIWLPDITRWAGTVAALLAPGGRFYMRAGDVRYSAFGRGLPAAPQRSATPF